MTFPHLNGRADKLADSLDLPMQTAEWLAVAALHSGCFLRSQYSDFYQHSRVSAKDFIHRLIKRKLIVESPADSLGLLARITNKSVYRLVDAGDIRHRRMGSWSLMFRRLLCLDYVLDCPQLPWLPTEIEKVSCFDELGIKRANLPRRVWHGKADQTVRYFGNKHPIAVDPHAKHALFVYTDSEEKSSFGVRSWLKEHAALWSDLHRQDFELRIVHASFNPRLAEGVSRLFSIWNNTTQSSYSAAEIEAELALVLKAIDSNDNAALRIYGGFNGALRASAALKAALNQRQQKPTVTANHSATYSTWLSERITQATSNPNPYGSRKVND